MGERMRVLEMIEAGDVSVEEAARRLEELAEGPGAPRPETEGGHEQPVARPALVRIVWQIVFWSGTTLMVVGGLLTLFALICFYMDKTVLRTESGVEIIRMIALFEGLRRSQMRFQGDDYTERYEEQVGVD